MSNSRSSSSWLIALDVDGVIFQSHFLIEMSRRVGAAAYLRAWRLSFLFNAGALPFPRLLERVYERFAGMPLDEAREVFQRMRLRPHAAEAVAAWRRAGCRVAAVSSGVPDVLLADLAERLQLDAYAGIQVGLDDRGALDGTVAGELTEPGGKIAAVERFHRQWGLNWERTLVVADDRNNLPVMARAAASIGLRPNWPVRRAATYIADSGDMEEVRALVEAHIEGRRVAPASREAFRKCVHAMGCLTPFAARISLSAVTAGLCAAAGLYALSEFFRLNGQSLPGITWVTRRSVRPEELRRPSLGPIFLAVSCAFCLNVFSWPAAAAAVFLVSLGDTAAAAVGRRWGRRKLPHSPAKTLEGALAFMAVGLAATLPLLPWPAALAACAAGAAVESLPIKDADNLFVPLAAGAAAQWLLG